MAERSPGGVVRVSVCLPEDVARRLQMVAVSQNRSASDVVVELLGRHLPRSDVRGPKGQKKIPYT